MWYLSTPDDYQATFSLDHMEGYQPSHGNYQLGFKQSPTTSNPSYIDIEGNSVCYDSDYFYALYVDERDQYDARKYYYEEVKDVVSTTPAHLFDPTSLYRDETSYTGNLVVQQKFFNLPFAVDLHFAYRETPFTSDEMDFTVTTSQLEAAKTEFDQKFAEIFIENDPVTSLL